MGQTGRIGQGGKVFCAVSEEIPRPVFSAAPLRDSFLRRSIPGDLPVRACGQADLIDPLNHHPIRAAHNVKKND